MIYTLYSSPQCREINEEVAEVELYLFYHLPSEGMNEPTGGHIGLPLPYCLVPLT